MADVKQCAECGALLPERGPAGGLCPRCLIHQGLSSRNPTRSAGAGAGFDPPDPEELAPHFPQLEIIELIGQGGMGAVYKARQLKLDRLVALKILAPHRVRDPAFAERFGREARTLARLSHPHVVGVHDFGEVDELYYFLMEYVDGASLREVMRGGRLTQREALALVPQICEALQFAHECGIVHRDIKPENILLDHAGRVKIADFGLAKLLEPERGEDVSLTASGAVLGTPAYMAPEQIEHPMEVDHRADIYAVGVVFYEMLTGELPLGRFDPPSSRVRLDVRLDRVVLRALEKEPIRRYQLASDVKADLEQLDGRAPAGDSTTPRPVAPRPTSPTSDPGSRTITITRPRLATWIVMWAFLMAALGLLMVAAAITVLLLPRSMIFLQARTAGPGLELFPGGWSSPGTILYLLFGSLLAIHFVGVVGYVVAGTGILRLRNWARYTLIVLCILEILGTLVYASLSFLTFMAMVIPSIVVPVLVIVYLSRRAVARIFEIGPRTVTLPDDEADALEHAMGRGPWV